MSERPGKVVVPYIHKSRVRATNVKIDILFVAVCFIHSYLTYSPWLTFATWSLNDTTATTMSAQLTTLLSLPPDYRIEHYIAVASLTVSAPFSAYGLCVSNCSGPVAVCLGLASRTLRRVWNDAAWRSKQLSHFGHPIPHRSVSYSKLYVAQTATQTNDAFWQCLSYNLSRRYN